MWRGLASDWLIARGMSWNWVSARKRPAQFNANFGPSRGPRSAARLPEPGTSPAGVSASSATNDPSTRKASAAASGKPTRYLAVAVRRETSRRDGGQCSFVSRAGRRCTARAFLEFDHIEPYARSGASDPRNVRLLCKAHDFLHARSCFGARHIAARIAARNNMALRRHRASEERAGEKVIREFRAPGFRGLSMPSMAIGAVAPPEVRTGANHPTEPRHQLHLVKSVATASDTLGKFSCRFRRGRVRVRRPVRLRRFRRSRARRGCVALARGASRLRGL